MPEPAVLHPDGHDLERFLYAPVGEDRNGSAVSVLSMLARLGLDPWKEAAGLSTLRREAALSRLGKLLSAFRDVPALTREHGAVAQALVRLLPEARVRRSKTEAEIALPGHLMISSRNLLAIGMVLLVLAQVLFTGGAGPGK